MNVRGSTAGDGAILVLLRDSGQPALALLEAALFSALRQMGIPFVPVDLGEELGDGRFEELLARHPLFLFPQSGTCGLLSSSRLERLTCAVREGLGLVVYEEDAALLPKDILSVLSVFPGSSVKGSCRTIGVERNDHYVTWLKEVGESYASDTPFAFSAVEGGGEGSGSLRNEAGKSMLFVSEKGKGRAVLFPFSIELFTMARLGHACGLDDVFSRSILWAARKPFLAWGMPRRSGLLIDDCSGSYDFFGYLDLMNERGWSPTLSLFTDAVDEVAHEDTEKAAKRLRRGWADGSLELHFHALRYNESFCFDHLGRRPLSEGELATRFERWDAYAKALGIAPCPWAHPHFGEISAAAIPYYAARGIEFITYLLPLDAAWFDVPSRIAPIAPQEPYGHNGYYMNPLASFPGIMACNCVLDRKTRTSSDYVVKTDYLWGNTPFWDESDGVDIGAASRTLADQVKRGLDSGFYGEGATHEQRIACLRKGELEEILAEADRLLERHEFERRKLSDIMAVAKRRRLCSLSMVESGGSRGAVRYEFSGEGACGTFVQLYVDGEDGRPRMIESAVSGRTGTALA